jgi:hydrogenase nickel incorporation protein HypA/HybF
MHEGAIAAAIVQGALETLEREGLASARSLTVIIGRLHSVVPDVLQDAYRILKQEQPALARSKLVIEILPVRITCRACGRETEIERPEFACPACGSTQIDVSGGREMHLKEILGVRRTADGGRPKKKSKSSSPSQTPNPK